MRHRSSNFSQQVIQREIGKYEKLSTGLETINASEDEEDKEKPTELKMNLVSTQSDPQSSVSTKGMKPVDLGSSISLNDSTQNLPHITPTGPRPVPRPVPLKPVNVDKHQYSTEKPNLMRPSQYATQGTSPAASHTVPPKKPSPQIIKNNPLPPPPSTTPPPPPIPPRPTDSHTVPPKKPSPHIINNPPPPRHAVPILNKTPSPSPIPPRPAVLPISNKAPSPIPIPSTTKPTQPPPSNSLRSSASLQSHRHAPPPPPPIKPVISSIPHQDPSSTLPQPNNHPSLSSISSSSNSSLSSTSSSSVISPPISPPLRPTPVQAVNDIMSNTFTLQPAVKPVDKPQSPPLDPANPSIQAINDLFSDDDRALQETIKLSLTLNERIPSMRLDECITQNGNSTDCFDTEERRDILEGEEDNNTSSNDENDNPVEKVSIPPVAFRTNRRPINPSIKVSTDQLDPEPVNPTNYDIKLTNDQLDPEPVEDTINQPPQYDITMSNDQLDPVENEDELTIHTNGENFLDVDTTGPPISPRSDDDSTNVSPVKPESTEGDTNVSPAKPKTTEGDTNVSPAKPKTTEDNTNVSPIKPKSTEGDTNVSPIKPKSTEGDTNVSPAKPKTTEGDTNVSPVKPKSTEGDTNVSPIKPKTTEGDTNVSPAKPKSTEGDTNVSPAKPKTTEGNTNVSPAKPKASERNTNVGPIKVSSADLRTAEEILNDELSPISFSYQSHHSDNSLRASSDEYDPVEQDLPNEAIGDSIYYDTQKPNEAIGDSDAEDKEQPDEAIDDSDEQPDEAIDDSDTEDIRQSIKRVNSEEDFDPEEVNDNTGYTSTIIKAHQIPQNFEVIDHFDNQPNPRDTMNSDGGISVTDRSSFYPEPNRNNQQPPSIPSQLSVGNEEMEMERESKPLQSVDEIGMNANIYIRNDFSNPQVLTATTIKRRVNDPQPMNDELPTFDIPKQEPNTPSLEGGLSFHPEVPTGTQPNPEDSQNTQTPALNQSLQDTTNQELEEAAREEENEKPVEVKRGCFGGCRT